MGFHSLAIGASALLTARYGIDVTGQNLGNVDTPGYSRQRLNQNALKGWTAGLNNAIIGTGVWTKSVLRVANEHVEKQLRQATSTDAYFTNLRYCYTNIQAFFNEPTRGNALSDSMNQFWNAMSDFSTHVESLPIRTTAVKEAEAMVARFNAMGRQLKEYRQSVNEQVRETINQINAKLHQIAVLNKEIVNNELGGVTGMCANDLRDQRGEIVKELYALMDIDVVEEVNGTYIVSIHGRNLVYYDQVNEVKNKTITSDDMMINIPVFGDDYYPLEPRDGQLAAMMEMRDVIIKSYKDDLDMLAGNFIWEFNKVYSQTRGLNSFDSLTSLNSPWDPAVTLDKLQYNDLIPPGTFQIVNGNLEVIVHNRNNNEETTVNIEISLDGRNPPGGEPDMILWDPDNPDAENSFVNHLQKAFDEAAPGAFRVTIDRQYRITIENTTSDYGFCFGRDTSGVLAALGLNVLFTGHNAITMGVNKDLLARPELMGGAYSFVPGDNTGANALLGFRTALVYGRGGMTIDDFYLHMVGRLGSEASRTVSLQEMQVDILHRMFTQREQISGVNEDEETIKLITYQRAFQAAAKYISTVDTLYETLIRM